MSRSSKDYLKGYFELVNEVSTNIDKKVKTVPGKAYALGQIVESLKLAGNEDPSRANAAHVTLHSGYVANTLAKLTELTSEDKELARMDRGPHKD
jgi:hypothetical protein